MGQELLHRLLGPLHPVGVVDVLNLGPQPGGVSQQLDQRRFVGDQRPQLVGVGGDQRKPDHGAAAAAKDVRRAAAERRQQPLDVLGLLGGRHILGGVLAAAVGDAARVIGRHGVAVGERAGQWGEPAAVHRRADQEQQRAAATPLVIEPRARHISMCVVGSESAMAVRLRAVATG
jgi:hypothetical protein